MTSATDAVGTFGAKVPVDNGAATSGYVPPDGTKTLATANRIEPSGHLFLTSVWVAKVPTCSPPEASPSGSACPNVAQPAVTLIVASVCAPTAVAKQAWTASSAATAQCRRSERIVFSWPIDEHRRFSIGWPAS